MNPSSRQARGSRQPTYHGLPGIAPKPARYATHASEFAIGVWVRQYQLSGQWRPFHAEYRRHENALLNACPSSRCMLSGSLWTSLKRFGWWARLVSNQRPIDYESTALTPELRALETTNTLAAVGT